MFFTVVQPPLNLTLAPQPQVPIRVGIKFEDSWRYWTAFDNAYNIPNQTMATKLSTWYAAYLDWEADPRQSGAHPGITSKGIRIILTGKPATDDSGWAGI